ncbi:hypothetical protein JTE90_029132 [Oedothorax gibbosus]|uniref:Uncharacterized protein n=1 Tax=Oedothorax gibbosus TaxID=931172 RepID=A0AAV6TLB3_9ARAC|nr:hypothetical protein JTE90_029132 [Oedothorax gibbosus]
MFHRSGKSLSTIEGPPTIKAPVFDIAPDIIAINKITNGAALSADGSSGRHQVPRCIFAAGRGTHGKKRTTSE